jgi:K+ transporter
VSVAETDLLVIVDLWFVTANMMKVPEGGRVPLAAGARPFWRYRRGGQASLHWRKARAHTTPLKEFIAGVHASHLGAICRQVVRGHVS